MGRRKLLLTFSIFLCFVLFSGNVLADDEDVEGSEENTIADDPVVADESSESSVIEPQDFITPDPPSNAFFADFFKDKTGIGKKWILSEAKKDGVDENIAKYNGEWTIDLPDSIVLKNDYGLIVKTKARHHAISSKLDRPFSFKQNKPLIMQYDVKFQNGQDCGGAYVKLLTTEKTNVKEFHDKTPFTIMFGPDKCGLQSKLHFIINYKNPKTGLVSEHQSKQTDKSLDSYFTDKKSHLYTLVLNPDSTYKIYIDQKEVASGDLLKNVEPAIVPAKEIDDANDSKPDDWDDKEKIPDPDAKKPENWDETAPEYVDDLESKRPEDWLEDQPEYIHDEKALKPDDWDEEMDGKWEAPLVKNPLCEGKTGCGKWTPPRIKNPGYKGKWKSPMISNPNFKGKWKPRKIENPDYFETNSPFEQLASIGAIGLELWTMSDGIIFDNFLITDDKSIADNYAISTWYIKQSGENRVANKSSFFGSLIEAAKDKPWLWAVYLLVVLIPIVLITIFCFSGSSKDQTGKQKKTDQPQPDVMDDEFQEEEEEGSKVEETEKDRSTRSNKSSPKKSAESTPRKVNKEDLEDSDEEENADQDEPKDALLVEEKSQSSSPRRRARKD